MKDKENYIESSSDHVDPKLDLQPLTPEAVAEDVFNNVFKTGEVDMLDAYQDILLTMPSVTNAPSEIMLGVIPPNYLEKINGLPEADKNYAKDHLSFQLIDRL